MHAVPHRLDPLPAQDSEDDHERVHEVREVPPGQFSALELLDVVRVVLAEKLHSHDGEDEDDDTQYEGQVTQRTHCSAHDGNQEIQSWP